MRSEYADPPIGVEGTTMLDGRWGRRLCRRGADRLEKCVDSTHHPAVFTRKIAAAAAVTALVVGGLFIPSASAEPDRADVVAKVEQAFESASLVNEEVLQIESDIAEAETQISSLSDEIASIQTTYDEQRDILGQSIVQQQIDTPLGPTASLLGSEDPEAFLDTLGAVQAFNSTQLEAIEAFTQTSADLSSRKTQLTSIKDQLSADKEQAEVKQAEAKAAYEAAQAQLEALDAAERARYDQANNTSEPVSTEQVQEMIAVAPSGSGGSAIDFALSQVGKPYRYGANGPDSYDCSGLTSQAFAAAGVSIPRTARAQYQASTKIPISEVQPGDLVFYGSMSHVAIYLGNGQIVEAPSSGKTLRVTTMRSSFTHAGRFG